MENKIRNRFNRFTIGQLEEFYELIPDLAKDPVALLELFDIDFTTIKASDWNECLKTLKTLKLDHRAPQKRYRVAGKVYRAQLNPFSYTAGQFIDMQWALSTGAGLDAIMAIVLVPCKKGLFGWKPLKYSVGYDPLELRKELKSNFLASDAKALSDFFLNQSVGLLRVTKEYLVKKEILMKYPEVKPNLPWRFLNGLVRLKQLLKSKG